MTGRAVLAAVALTLLGGVVGCSRSADSAHVEHPRSTPSSVTSAAPQSAWTPTAPAGTPLGAGERVWAAFSHRGVPYGTWWAALAPLLSEGARAAYVYDDPSNLPVMTPTGAIHLADKPPAEARYTAEVLVPTNVGVFGLDLERHKIGSPWLLYAIKFPPGVG